MNKSLLSLAALVIALIAFFGVNIAGSTLFRGVRADLTEGRLYTLSDGSRAIARKLDEPITLTLYFSEKVANDVPQFKSYATRVKEILGEYERASGGKVRLKFVNPEAFSEAEDQAVAAGLAGVPTGRGGEQFYFGLVGVNSTDKKEIIPFFDPGKESFLEYDITRLVYLLGDPPKKTVGLITWLPMEGAPFNPMTGQRGGTPPWQMVTQMKELFDVRPMEPTIREIPADVGVLMVVHPKGISDDTLYAIDQFVMRGGRLLVFVDPLCEGDVPPGMNPMQAMQIPKASELDKLFSAWGIEVPSGKVAADRDNALKVGAGRGSEPVDFITWMNLGKDEVNTSDPAVGNIASIIIQSPGIVKKKDGSTLDMEPLVHTSSKSMTLDAANLAFPDPKGLLSKFKSEDATLTLAAKFTGKVKSAFPTGAPAPKPAAEGQPAPAALTTPALAESKDSATIVVFADCDILKDEVWVRRQQLGPIDLGMQKISDNGDLVIGLLDNLGGSSDLMSLRARNSAARPFARVEGIRKDAETRFAQKEEELQTKLRQTEGEINKLLQQKPDGQATALLTPEAQQKLDEFRQQAVTTRKELRTVKHDLRKDIESLGSGVKAINMIVMPGVVGLAAIALTAWRASRRKTDRAAAGPRT